MVDVVGIGESGLDEVCLVPAYPPRGGKVEVTRRLRLGGGQVATALCACARLGLRARLVGAVGDDEAGRFVLDELRREGVDTAWVQVRPGAATPPSYIIVDQGSGERTVLFSRRPTLAPTGVEQLREALRGARALHLDVTDLATALPAARCARDLGLLTSIDADHVPEGAADELLELLCLIDLVVVAAEFLPAFTGAAPADLTNFDAAAGLRALQRRVRERGGRDPQLCCVTLGSRGCVALRGDDALAVPGFAVPVVDTTGCGDVFHGALIHAVLTGLALPEALRWGCAAAALKATALGGRAGIPTAPALRAFLAQRGGA